MPVQIPKCDQCSKNDSKVTCINCEENFCTGCDSKHHSTEKRMKHKRVPCTGTEISSRFCSVKGHEGQTIPLYCQNCLKPLCALCVIGEHKNHTTIPLQSAVENAKAIIQANIVPIQKNIEKIDQDLKLMEEDMKKLEAKITDAKKRRNAESQKLEDLKSWVTKQDVDPNAILSLLSELKLEWKVELKHQATLAKNPVELISSNGLTRKGRTFISNSPSCWRSVRGKEKWSSGVHEFTFIMKVRGCQAPTTSVMAGIAQETIDLDSQCVGVSDGGVGYGNTGKVYPAGIQKFPWNENQKIRIVYDQSTVIFYVEKSEVYRQAISGCFVPCVSLYANSVIEWVD